MDIRKQVLYHLTKCYSIAPLTRQGRLHFLVAAEKNDPCLLFGMDGQVAQKVWDGPGGTMSMVQVPGTDGQFLATQKFYSPNDSKEARIVLAAPGEDGAYAVRTICPLPFVHRFDILETRNGNYLIACTLKSGHDYKDDWTKPGRVYAARLPEDLSAFDEAHPLPLTCLREGLTKNHGYCRIREGADDQALVSAEEGVFLFTPPEGPDAPWQVTKLLDVPASDAALVDLDGDGQKELAVLSPFHGDTISIYHKEEDGYRLSYTFPEKAEFCHAIYGGELWGRPSLVVGNRKGKRDLMLFTYDHEKKDYRMEIIDRDCGSANVEHIKGEGREILISANRETDEIALYEADV